MKNGISFKAAIAIIDKVDAQGKACPFDISFRTLQRNSRTGGRLVTYRKVKKYRVKKGAPHKKAILKTVQSGTTTKRHPNHYTNRTRNLELQNGEIKKIHVRLIDTINGKKMHY